MFQNLSFTLKIVLIYGLLLIFKARFFKGVEKIDYVIS
jgi:hypothetical protein